MEPSRGRALLRIERAARASPTFARAYRRGQLTALEAFALVALVLAELGESKLEAWVEWARGTTLQRLRDAVDRALLLRETDWEAWLRTGGLPDSESGAESAAASDVPGELGIGAQHSASEETHSVGCQLELEVIRVFRALLCTVQKRLEPEFGRLPTRGVRGSRLHVDAEPAGSPHRVPLRGRVGRSRKPGHTVRVSPSAGVHGGTVRLDGPGTGSSADRAGSSAGRGRRSRCTGRAIDGLLERPPGV